MQVIVCIRRCEFKTFSDQLQNFFAEEEKSSGMLIIYYMKYTGNRLWCFSLKERKDKAIDRAFSPRQKISETVE